MPFTRAWDESAPPGSSLSNTIDTIFQNLKIDLRERLEQVIVGFSDDAVDPKKIKVNSGLDINRPSSLAAEAGEAYLATNTGDLSLFDGTNWIAISPNGAVMSYDNSQPVGSKVTQEVVADKIFGFHFSGTTDGSGDITIDAGELDTLDINWALVLARTYQPLSAACAQVIEISRTSSILTLRAFDYAGAPLTSTAIVISAVMMLYG